MQITNNQPAELPTNSAYNTDERKPTVPGGNLISIQFIARYLIADQSEIHEKDFQTLAMKLKRVSQTIEPYSLNLK
jgi:hypothetical protein